LVEDVGATIAKGNIGHVQPPILLRRAVLPRARGTCFDDVTLAAAFATVAPKICQSVVDQLLPFIRCDANVRIGQKLLDSERPRRRSWHPSPRVHNM